MIDPDLAYTYVLARVDLAQKIVVISSYDKVLRTYDYSTDTIGKWAADDDDDETLKEQNCHTDSCTSEH
jgi:hypothetical protein